MQTQLTVELDSVKQNLLREYDRYRLQAELVKQGAVWALLSECLTPENDEVRLSNYAKDGLQYLCKMMSDRAQEVAFTGPLFDREVREHFQSQREEAKA